MARAKTTERVDRRDELLRVGMEMFDTIAYDEIAVADIAAKAGVAHGLLFHYFGSKRKFFVEVMRQEVTEISAIFAANPYGPQDPVRWLRWDLGMFVRLSRDRPESVNRVGRGATAIDPELDELFRTVRQTTIQRHLEVMGATEPAPLLEGALYGWIGFAFEAMPRWLGANVSDRRIQRLLTDQLVATLHNVARIDKRATFDPKVFDGA